MKKSAENTRPTAYDIRILSRNGPRVARSLSKIIYFMTQYMMEEEDDSMSFEVEGAVRNCSISTEFKKGLQGDVCGTLFRTFVEYADRKEPTELLFLSAYAIDWRMECTNGLKKLSEKLGYTPSSHLFKACTIKLPRKPKRPPKRPD